MFALDVAALVGVIAAGQAARARPFIVAIDGRSGVGKSTLARRLAGPLGAALIEGDDFFAGGVAVRNDTPRERAAVCIDWRRQRPVLEALRQGRRASWQRFDWDAFDGRLERVAVRREPADIVLLEGVYSARPELADLLDLRILLAVPEELRRRQLIAREGSLSAWELQWHEAEEHYFSQIVRAAEFDVVLARR